MNLKNPVQSQNKSIFYRHSITVNTQGLLIQMTASLQRDLEAISLWHGDIMGDQVALIVAFSSSILLGWGGCHLFLDPEL